MASAPWVVQQPVIPHSPAAPGQHMLEKQPEKLPAWHGLDHLPEVGAIYWTALDNERCSKPSHKRPKRNTPCGQIKAFWQVAQMPYGRDAELFFPSKNLPSRQITRERSHPMTSRSASDVPARSAAAAQNSPGAARLNVRIQQAVPRPPSPPRKPASGSTP